MEVLMDVLMLLILLLMTASLLGLTSLLGRREKK